MKDLYAAASLFNPAIIVQLGCSSEWSAHALAHAARHSGAKLLGLGDTPAHDSFLSAVHGCDACFMPAPSPEFASSFTTSATQRGIAGAEFMLALDTASSSPEQVKKTWAGKCESATEMKRPPSDHVTFLPPAVQTEGLNTFTFGGFIVFPGWPNDPISSPRALI